MAMIPAKKETMTTAAQGGKKGSGSECMGRTLDVKCGHTSSIHHCLVKAYTSAPGAGLSTESDKACVQHQSFINSFL